MPFGNAETALHNSLGRCRFQFFFLPIGRRAEILGARLFAGKLTGADGNPCLPQSTTSQHLCGKEERQQFDARICLVSIFLLQRQDMMGSF